MLIRSLDDLAAADERSLRFMPFGFGLDRALTPAAAAAHQQTAIADCDLAAAVPPATLGAFERIRRLHAHGVLFYDAFTIAYDQCGLALELALRERFLAWHRDHPRAVTHKRSRDLVEPDTTWDDVDSKLRSRKLGQPWIVETDGGAVEFTGNVKTLLRWARTAGLLPGHRSRGLDLILHEARISAGHMRHHLVSPIESARAIHDLAEIVNQLWGHSTPDGRLFPSPFALEPITIAWSEDDLPTVSLAPREALAAWDPMPEWQCVIVAARRHDPGLTTYDSWYEHTAYPTTLLWGPGRLADARDWLAGREMATAPVVSLDRVFVVRYDETTVDGPMRPSVAAALARSDPAGEWLLVRADHPDDAYRHGTHRRAGLTCVPLDGPTDDEVVRCATQELFAGTSGGLLSAMANLGTLSAGLEEQILPPHVTVPGPGH